MSDSGQDEELKRAIALSLEQISSPVSIREKITIDLVSSDEDDDLDAPVATRFKFSHAAIALKASTDSKVDSSPHGECCFYPQAYLF